MKTKSPKVFKPRAGIPPPAKKTPAIDPATFAKFDGAQLLLIAKLIRARRINQEDGGVFRSPFSEFPIFWR